MIAKLVAATSADVLGWEPQATHYSDGTLAYVTMFDSYRLRYRTAHDYLHGNGFSFTADVADLDVLSEAITEQQGRWGTLHKPGFINALDVLYYKNKLT